MSLESARASCVAPREASSFASSPLERSLSMSSRIVCSTVEALSSSCATMSRRLDKSFSVLSWRSSSSSIRSLPDVEIGHLSKKIDAILQRAILDGWNLPLDKGLDLESRAFGECVETKDMHLGMETFLTQGARAKAAFTHE